MHQDIREAGLSLQGRILQLVDLLLEAEVMVVEVAIDLFQLHDAHVLLSEVLG